MTFWVTFNGISYGQGHINDFGFEGNIFSMLSKLFIICTLPLWVIAFNNGTNVEPTFVPRCNPLIQCDAYFSVAGFAEVSCAHSCRSSGLINIFIFEVNWLEANYICNRVGAVLATVRNEEQHQLLIHYVHSKGKVGLE